MNTDFDIAVVGSGFAGSLMAMIARRLGHSVALIERGRHPRFAIGESSTPLANLLLEELAERYDLPELASLSKWGSWKQAHPEIVCGLKRGFTFYHHRFGESWQAAPERPNELLVAASPHDAIADTHWYRADLDAFFVRQAEKLGVELLEETELESADFSQSISILTGKRLGPPLQLRARLVIDASGPRGFLHRALRLGEAPLAEMPATEGLFTHFENVSRWDTLHPSSTPPPYPVDDAAMHHVFDEGWIWVLRFNNHITSAGAALASRAARDLRLAEGAAAWERLLARLPSVREQFSNARATMQFIHAPRLSFRSVQAAGEQWAMLPSSAGFVDPLLSTGFPLTLLGVSRMADILEKHWQSPALVAALAGYSTQTLRELDATAELVGTLYARMNDFALFRALTLLYFAAASFSETARRLEKPELASDFLLIDRPNFMKDFTQCLKAARGPLDENSRAALFKSVAAAIAPINVAGLGDPARRHWYPALAADLFAAAPKLGMDRTAIERLLERCRFSP